MNAESKIDSEINTTADDQFDRLFLQNEFGYACDVCDRLWFKQDLVKVTPREINVLKEDFEGHDYQVENFKICSTCRQSLSHNRIPHLSQTNGYKYPDHPSALPPLDPITERLISPRLPFMQIRRLRRDFGTYKIIGQIINIPVEVDNMVTQLPRELDDDYTFNVNIKKHLQHQSSYLNGQIKKRVVEEWLSYMITTPLYKRHGIQHNSKDFLDKKTTT